MMEMQQTESRPMNVYDNPKEQTKTEDVYESLHTSPTRSARKASGKKIMVTLLTISILLLTTILLVVGLYYHQFRQSVKEMLNDQKPSQEMWYLHDDSFYLFWSNHSDCETAYKFCKKRTADLTFVRKNNKDWLQSHINGKRLLVKAVGSDGFYWPMRKKESVHPGCVIFGETSHVTEQVEVEGWVCERQTTSICPS